MNGGTNREFHPLGINSPLGDKFTPGGQLRPWGSKFAPRGEVKNGLRSYGSCDRILPGYRVVLKKTAWQCEKAWNLTPRRRLDSNFWSAVDAMTTLLRHQRLIFNLAPRGELCPLGVSFVPWGWALSPGGEVIPWGLNSLFAPTFY
jgi:hypothetical protein